MAIAAEQSENIPEKVHNHQILILVFLF